MASLDILRKWKNNNPSVRNIVLFISDSLRWDYLPESVARLGTTFKTVASSLFTPSSFASMVSGLYPPNHKVYWFTDRLPAKINSLINLDGYNTSLWNENTWIEYSPPEFTPLHRLLKSKRVALDEIATPFIYLEDEKGGHCPYGWSFGDKDYQEWDCPKFFRDYGRKEPDELLQRYLKGISRSVEIFKERLATLDRRGLTEESLVIFTSDHGELLGEYGGHVGHGEIACPEVAYVPTVFIHPRLPSGISFENEGILRHVDLYPTILDILGVGVPYPVDGTSLITASKMPEIGCNFLEVTVARTRKWIKIPGSCKHKEVSVWDKNGGHKFRADSSLLRLLFSVYRTMVEGVTANYLRGYLKRKNVVKALKAYVTVLRYYLIPYVKYGSPEFSRKDAQIIIQKIESAERERIIREIRRLKGKGKI